MPNKRGLLLLFFLISNILFSQNKDDYRRLIDFGIKTCKVLDQADYCKTINYFKNKKYDSCYLFSEKAITNKTLSPETKDVLFYMKSVSAVKLGLYQNALSSLNAISKKFPFYQLKNYRYGMVYLELEKYDSVISIYNKWLRNNPTNRNAQEVSVVYHNLASAYMLKKQFKKSEFYFKKVINEAQKINNTVNIINAKSDLANLYYEQYKDHLAIPLFKEVYELAKHDSSLELKQNTAKNMAVVEKNRKHYKESTSYYEEYIKWKDSLWNRDKISQLLEKDKQIALVKKDKEIAIQKETTLKQKERIQLFIIILIIALLFLGVLFYLYRFKIKQNTLIQAQKEQLEHLNTTKNYLLSVISHDLRTPVNTIKANHKKLSVLLNSNLNQDAITLNKKSEAISESTSGILNNILNWALQQNNQLLFIPENHFINLLIVSILEDFRSIAQAKNISISTVFEDSDSLVFLDKELFKIAFRNLIDNAIKYTPEGGSIKVKTAFTDTMCILTIADTGQGMSQDVLNNINNYNILTVEKIDRSKGLGLGLILSKTLLIKNKGTFEIENNLNKGITITIELPIKEL